MLAIVGQSGTGKSTLLHILGALDSPSEGDVYCAEQKLRSLSDDAAAEFRNRELGFVWQFHYLLPEFKALENVAMPLLVRGISRGKAEAEARKWLREVGLRPGAPSVGGTIRRRATERGYRTRPSNQAEIASGGRAYRRSRQPDRRGGF